MTLRLLHRRLRVRLVLALAALSTMTAAPRAVLPPGNAVQQWNRIAEDTVVASNAFRNEGFIYMAYVSAAVYDAVMAIEGGSSRTRRVPLRLRRLNGRRGRRGRVYRAEILLSGTGRGARRTSSGGLSAGHGRSARKKTAGCCIASPTRLSRCAKGMAV